MDKTNKKHLLDDVETKINQGLFSEAFNALYHGLDSIRRHSSKKDWKQFIAQYRQHAVSYFFLQEPFSRRAFDKPRGYAGDPVMMDSIYDFDKTAPPPYEGRQAEISELLNYELNRISYANDAVRERKRIFSSKIDETAERVANPYILSFPSGHLREVLESVAVKNKRIGKFVAIDQDQEALSVAAEIIKDFGETIPASIVDIIENEVPLPGFDFIYSVGVFDYLPNGVAKKLVNELFNLLNPGGRLLIANWLPDTPSIAYMEAALDWWITYRTKEQMQELTEAIPEEDIHHIDIFVEKYEVVVFMEIEKAGEVNSFKRKGMELLKLHEVRKQMSTPLGAPAYPVGPYHFRNREYLNILYRTDTEALRRVVPEPLEIDEPLVKFELMYMPDVTGLGAYTESGQLIPVSFNGEKGEYQHAMYVDSLPAIAAGREISAYPKKLGSPKLYIDSDTLVGTLDYGSLRVATATMGYKHQALDPEQARQEICQPTFMLKIVPNYDGTQKVCQLMRTQIKNLTIHGAWTAPARLQLFAHALAPLADLPVLEVVSASHIVTDLGLSAPDVIYDYLAEH